ncbi:alpha/beta hydrolase [Rhizobacter sp. J219]|uniref:alpha/beta hydrolase n=1 Tax=Rhizobacter sp. J219 TaxID=2898430 RepID=UPI0021517104|nr:alpha/beta hydrolase [Rhizobacter sp. J219]MCR5885283.1 alpha/beta hydrolase [Rhizobacter sp. J219]
MLDLQLAAMMKQVQAAGLPDLADLPPEPCRGLYRQILAAADMPPADVAVANLSTDGAHPVVLRVYTPRLRPGPHPVIVYYHGGGYVLGDLDGYDNVCRQLCSDSDAIVVSVDYRLAPEHPFPAAVDDAWQALRWVARHAAALGADTARLAVAGDSAGAVLATVMCLLARDADGPRVAFQALLYPPAAGGRAGDYPSHQQHAAGPTLTLRTMEYFSRHCFGPTGMAPDFRGAPLLAPRLGGLPPALLLVAGHDPLRDEALAYGRALLAAGTPTTVVEFPGLAHGFISMAGGIASARLAQRLFAQALRDGLAATDTRG